MEMQKIKKEKRGLTKGVYILPNLFTTGNIFCGFYAIISAINGNFYYAAIAILLAMVFDCLDGKIARLTNSASDFGLNYDSLADIISFGMAPGILIYLWVLKPFGRIGWLAAFLYLICSALRLARFNVQTVSKMNDDFAGLPTPAAAGVVSALVIMLKDVFVYEIAEPLLMVFTVYSLAFLMVSNIPYKSFKKLDLTKRQTFNILIFAILVIYIVAVIPQIMFFIITISYALSGPAIKLVSYIRSFDESRAVKIKD